MRTTETECLDALQRAAERLGESPTKAAYEELGLTPASATIIRVMNGWNTAKAAAGLETYVSTGSRAGPKPDDVTLPKNVTWESLSVDQRWHYRNVDWNTERTLDRRAELRAWAHEYKRADGGCVRCVEDDPACLDFHHTDTERKEMTISSMISYGYSKERLLAEIEKCEILCANCHRKRHYTIPDPVSARDASNRDK